MKLGQTLAFDVGSVRSYDSFGRMHVALTNISKANVCPYYGSEIVDGDGLGLEPTKIYYLYRDPEELAKAAPTFNNIQLLSTHRHVSPESPQKSIVAGSTGTDAVFEAPYLKNSLVVWDADAIRAIESSEQKELSCGYKYTPDMTPGEVAGVKYDGVMRNIIGNHIALVEHGRAGEDVFVGDTLEHFMAKKLSLSQKAAVVKGMLTNYLKPKLATDAKIDLNALVKEVTAENWLTKKPAVIDALKLATKGKLAKDEDLKDAPEALSALDDEDAMEDAPAGDGDKLEKLVSFLTGKLGDEDMELVKQLIGKSSPQDVKSADVTGAADPAKDEDGNAALIAQIEALVAKLKSAPASPEAVDADGEKLPEPVAVAPTSNPKENVVKPEVTKAAMDAALKTAVQQAERNTMQKMRDIAEAEELVRPLIGKVIAQDSAESVFRLALEAGGVDLKGVHPSAFKAMISMLPREGASKPAARIAQDSVAIKSFEQRFPEAATIRQLG